MSDFVRGMLPVLLGGELILSGAAASSTLNNDDLDFVKRTPRRMYDRSGTQSLWRSGSLPTLK